MFKPHAVKLACFYCGHTWLLERENENGYRGWAIIDACSCGKTSDEEMIRAAERGWY